MQRERDRFLIPAGGLDTNRDGVGCLTAQPAQQVRVTGWGVGAVFWRRSPRP